MNKLTKIIAVFLILLAACLAALAWWMGRQIPEKAPVAVVEPAPSYPAVIAAAQLENGKRIEEQSLRLIESPRPIPGSYQSIASVAGRIAANDIAPETLITESNLVQGIALQLADGERALALPVDEVVGVGNKLKPGDYVDVFMTLKEGSHIEKGQARLLASRLRVLSYGALVIGNSESAEENTLRKSSSSSQPRTAVLATPVEEVNSLLLAAQNGKLALALRHPGDTGMADAGLFPQAGLVLPPRNGLTQREKEALLAPDNRAFAGLDVATWSADKQRRDTVARPAPAAKTGNAPHRTLEVIKGTQREQVRF